MSQENNLMEFIEASATNELEVTAKKQKLADPNQQPNTYPAPWSLRRKKKRTDATIPPTLSTLDNNTNFIQINKTHESGVPCPQDSPLDKDIGTPSGTSQHTSISTINNQFSSSETKPAQQLTSISSIASELNSSNSLISNLQQAPAPTIPRYNFPLNEPLLLGASTLVPCINTNNNSDTNNNNNSNYSTNNNPTNNSSQDELQIECSVDDLVASGSTSIEDQAAKDLNYESVLETASKNKADMKTQLLKHLAGVILTRKDIDVKDNKLLLPNIARNFQRIELRSFLTNHFQSKACVDDKEKKKRAAELRKRKPTPETFAEEIRMMMHAFGDVPNAEVESAKYLDFIIKRFISTLVSNIKEVLPQDTTKPHKVNAEVLYVALLPDIKKIYRVQQGIRHLVQSRSLKHTEETTNDGPDIATTTEPELENLLEQAHVPISAVPLARSQHKSTDEASSVLFDTPFWRAKLAVAAQHAEAEKLERHQWKDRLSQQVPATGFAHFMQCTSVSFTKPHRRKLEDYMREHCGLGTLEMTGKVVEMVGLLTYDMLMDLVVATLRRKQTLKLGSGPLSPIHIYGFMESLSVVPPSPSSQANSTNSSSSSPPSSTPPPIAAANNNAASS